ncbi:MAG: SpoIIE family protein phosphatase [Magnetococcus sp. DMHC-8]
METVGASPSGRLSFGIRARLLGFTAVLILLVSVVLTAYSAVTNRDHLLEVYQENAIDVGDTLAEAVGNDLYRMDLRGLRQRLGAVHKNKAITATFILDEQGRVLADGTSANSQRGQRPDDPFIARLLASREWVVERGEHLLKLGRAITLVDGDPLGRLYLQLSLADLHQKIIHQLQETLLIAVGCILFSFVVAWWFAARFTRPITALTRAADRIRSGDVLAHVQIPVTGHDEIRTLSVSLEEMLRRLQASDRELRGLNVSLDQKVQERTQALQETLLIVHSSIQYASRIQRSILPDPDFFRFVLPQHCVVWQPRDVVGGDLYWCRLWGLGTLLVVGDCTGHGVPGAFMTLIANGALGHAINTTPPGQLATLITTMHSNIQEVLGREQSTGSADDGVELGACYLAPGAADLLFVGARFSLFCQDPGQPVVERKGDRTGIGHRYLTGTQLFAEQSLARLPGRRFFLATDGMIDQVGGAKRLGLGKKRFKHLLEQHAQTPIQAVGTRLYEALVAYQGEERRRDDVTIVGFIAPQQGDQDACP